MTAPLACYSCFSWRWLPDGTLRLGWPFLAADGSIIQSVIEQHARFGTVVLEIDGCLARPDVVAALRTANPSIRVVAFANLNAVFWNPDHSMQPATDVSRAIYDAALQRNGFLWSAKDSGCWYNPWDGPEPVGAWSPCNANLASSDYCDALFGILRDAALSPLFNGNLFLDLAGSRIPRDPSKDVPDYDRAGFPTTGLDYEMFDTAFAANHARLVQNLYSAGVRLYLNDGGLTSFTEVGFLAGSMRESFPYRPDGTEDWLWWFQWAQHRAANSPEPWINAVPPSRAGTSWSLADPANADFARFALATAYLAGGRLSLTTNERPAEDERWAQWLSEYDLDLGAPLSPAVAFKGGYLREFERGCVTAHPALQQGRIYTSGS